MQDYVVNRPEEGAMNRILTAAGDSAAGVILRLAWQAGLLRDEIQRLTWAQVDFNAQRLLLPDREVPIPPELSGWLEALRDSRNRCSPVVVLSDRDRKPLTPQSISRLARAALDSEGQTAVRLIDLRHDYILRQLEEHDWQYVSRITGVESTAMKLHFAGHLKEKKVSTRVRRETPAAHIDEFTLWKLLQAEGTSPAGVALWLAWQLGLRLEEIVALRWDQVDLAGERLVLPERTAELPAGECRSICAYSDGFAQLMQFVPQWDGAALHRQVMEQGAQALLDRLYDMQEQDREMLRVPRFKLRDDTTAAAAEIEQR